MRGRESCGGMGLTTRDESMTSSSSSAALTSFTWKDVREHQDEDSCWLVIHNDVHDVTKFLEDHPGGKEFLLEAVGEDASDDFDQVRHHIIIIDVVDGLISRLLCRFVTRQARQAHTFILLSLHLFSL